MHYFYGFFIQVCQKDSPYMPRRVLVSRTDNNNKTTTFAVNPRQNEVLLMPNDTVYVPQRVVPTVGKLFDYTTRLFTPFYLFSNTYKGCHTCTCVQQSHINILYSRFIRVFAPEFQGEN